MSGNGYNLTIARSAAIINGDSELGSFTGKVLNIFGVADIYSQEIKFNKTFTIELWIKPDQLVGSQTAVAFSSYSVPISTMALYFNSAGICTLLVSTTNGFISAFGPSSSKLIVNKWNHLAGSCDTDKCYIYVNGVKGDSIAIPVNYSFNNILAQFEVGTYRGLSRITTGSLDEIKIYGKGMAAAEVQKHYAEGIYRLQLAELTNNSLLK